MGRMLLAVVLLCGVSARIGAAEPLVQTTCGPVLGVALRDGAVQRFLGLPYAQPPVGELRWKAPQPPAAWTDVRRADAYGAACAQRGGMYGPPPIGKPWGPGNIETYGKPVGSEDCLTLNIWRPVSAQPLPVILWVHGGSNVAGFSADPIYDAERLAVAANAVVVTINYRLGIFGWFTHPSLHDGDPLTASGNYGNLDIIQALRFVQANAAAFGGDPGNVTAMGQSAGAINVYALMASPLAKDLFHKAIVLSGLIGDASKPQEGHEYAGKLAAAAGYTKTEGDAGLGAYLKSKSANELLGLQIRDEKLRKAPGGFGDGTVFPTDVGKAFDEGRFNQVPTLVGVTRDEAKLFLRGTYKVTDAQRFTLMTGSDPNAPPSVQTSDILSGWMPRFLYNASSSTLTALLMRGVTRSVNRVSKYEPRVYVYRFDWDEAPEPWKTLYGAAHAIDLPFVFGNFTNNFFAMDFSEANRPGREALSQMMMGSIGAFVRSGDPNTAGLPVKWPAWDPDVRKKLVLDASETAIKLSVQD
jgi:para-nitrobenzyl esterase